MGAVLLAGCSSNRHGGSDSSGGSDAGGAGTSQGGGENESGGQPVVAGAAGTAATTSGGTGAASTSGGSAGRAGGGTASGGNPTGGAPTGGATVGGNGSSEGGAGASGENAGGDGTGGGTGGSTGGEGGSLVVRAPTCNPADDGGSAQVAKPVEIGRYAAGWSEGWSGSPAIADLDGDGVPEIVVAREGEVVTLHADGTEVFTVPVEGRCWSPAIVAELRPGEPGLEVVAACRGRIYAWNASGEALSGFPYEWEDEFRSIAAGDIDGDGQLELVAGTTSDVESQGQTDILIAIEADGSVVSGFPPNASGSGCDDACYVHAGYDQNVGLGDVDDDGVPDIFLPQDNAYFSLHDGTGRAFDAADIFDGRTKVQGVRGLHDYAEAQQGWANDEATALQAHFTNSAPAITDVDGDGSGELVVVASVQNAAQTNREQGVALWVLNNDGTRPDGWVEPLHFPGYLSGLWDYGNNVVAITNQVTAADIDPTRDRAELLFAGFDGLIHAVSAAGEELWSYRYTSADNVGTGGVLVVDLSGDGIPEVVFATYSTDSGVSSLVILDSGGSELHTLPLPERGAMPVPAIGDADGDGDLEIVVSLKDSDPQVLVFEVPGSGDNCLLWPTGRANNLRNGWIP